MITLPNKSDVAIAAKAINLSPDLSASARRVAGALLDHFNRETGRCDPSIERLAELLGINRATVLRATAELSKKELFVKRSHGGQFHCANYQPQWQKFRDIVGVWDAKMKGVTQEDNVAIMRHKPILPTNPMNLSYQKRHRSSVELIGRII